MRVEFTRFVPGLPFPMNLPGKAAMPYTDSSSADSRAHDAAILALTLYAEAGDRPLRAIEALAALVMNRHRSGQGHWGQGITGICRAPFQFPCWNTRHPHHARLRAAAPGGVAAHSAQMELCHRVALRALAGALPDPTGGATHMHADDSQPSWSIGRTPVAEIGGLLFYRPEPAEARVRPRGPALALAV